MDEFRFNLRIRSLLLKDEDERWQSFCEEFTTFLDHEKDLSTQPVKWETYSSNQKSGKGELLASVSELLITAGGIGALTTFFTATLKILFDRMNARKVILKRDDKGQITELEFQGYSPKDIREAKKSIKDFLSHVEKPKQSTKKKETTGIILIIE